MAGESGSDAGPDSSPCYLQKFRLYETRSNFYMIGRDKNRTLWRVLKIDRLDPSELTVIEDSTAYSEIECFDLLRRIHEGNRSSGGLKFVTACYGIVGFIKFLGSYSMMLITKRMKIGAICGHTVYAISKSEMIPISKSPNQSNMAYSKNEKRYKKLLSTVDLTKDFFFSYTYNVMHSLQRNLCRNETGEVPYETMFVWNEFLTRGIRNTLKNTLWTVALVYGFFKQVKLSVSGRDFCLTLISRRSRHYAGTRYLKRGVNEKGRVANDVETEQIVFEDVHEGCPTQISSVVQNRGSIPLFGFFIRRKWRLSIARQAEIKRLMILASEEAARAELEASIGYGSVPVSRNYHQCAVCYCPTTTRCARCKAVRYCSTQCQVIHWRQGHKKECYPAAVAIHQNHDEGSDCDFGQKVTEQHQIGDGFESKEKQHAEPTKSSSKESGLHNSTTEPALSSSTSCSAVLLEKDDDIKVEFQADGEGRSIASESSSTSFSGFSSSVTGSESSDDVSVCESVGSNEPCRLEISSSADDSKLDTLWTASGVSNVDQTNLSSPKFASLVDSVGKFSKLNASNQMKPDQGGEIQCRASGSSSGISDMSEGSTSEVRTLSSGFWGRTLEPVVSTNDANDETFQSNPKEGGESASLDPGSSLHFSFSLSQNASSLPPQGLTVKAAKLDDAPRSASGYTQLSNGVTLPENVDLDAPNVSRSSSSNSECANHVECGSTNVSPIPKPREAINRDVPLVSSLSSSCSEKSDSSSVINGPSASHLLKSSDAYSSSARLHAVPNAKSGNFGGVHANAATLPKVSSSSDSTHGLKTSMRKIADQFRGSKLPKHYPLGVGNEDSGNYNDKVLFSYESFVKLYSGSKANLQPCGLVNCGNSCYANAILQCLTFTPPLTAYFLQGLHSKACAKKEWCFTCDLENLILKAKEGKSPLSPKGILSQLQNICGQLVQGKEEDAHEFLRYVIDVMQFDCLKEAGVRSSGCSEEETTLIGLTFGGFLRSKIMCVKCQGKSERYERMMDLTVEIEGDIETLEEALHRFTRTEILDGENKYQCGRCNSYEKAKKKLTISEAPNVLTIALKRFQSGKFGKLNKAIQFPEILNLAPYTSGTSDNSPIYRLYGVVVHLDIMNAAFSGHYVCYVKNAQNKWFKIDDSKVTSSELGNVLTKGAYMLFYARCSPRAPRSIRSRSKSILSKINSKNYPKSSSTHPDSSGSIESFYSKYNRLQKILEEDSSSDTSSLFGSNSDNTSSCTDSTQDDSLDSVFGDSDASSSPSSSPLYSKHSPLADLDRYDSGSPEIDPLFHSNTSKQCRDVGSYSNSSSSRETDSELLGRVNSLNEVYFRKSLKKRTN